MGRKLGQHFLHSPAVLDAIAAAAGLRPGEPVLEIGPGKGALTERLLATGARLTAIELDAGLAGALRARWKGHPGFRLLEGDVLKTDLSPDRLFGTAGPCAVVANLPYYLSTPLLFRFAACRGHFSRLVLMVQQEVAARIAAAPEDGKAYGSLSIALQHAFSTRVVRRVSPGAFRPPPKVHSAVVALEPLPPRLRGEDEGLFFSHVKALFTRRRKRMAGGLQEEAARLDPAAWEAIAGRLGHRRAEELTPEEHLEVFLALHPHAEPLSRVTPRPSP